VEGRKSKRTATSLSRNEHKNAIMRKNIAELICHPAENLGRAEKVGKESGKFSFKGTYSG